MAGERVRESESGLFADLVDSVPRARRKGFAWVTSTLAHAGIAAALLLVPLLWPGDPPEAIDTIRVLLYDPPPPPPLPPPRGSQLAKPARLARPVAPEPGPTPVPKLVAELEAPTRVPDAIAVDPGVAEEQQFGLVTGHELGVPEGIEGGDPFFGQVGGVLGGVPGGVVGGTGTVPVRDYDRPPRPIKLTKPRYPQAAFIKKVEGTVTLEILIDERGNVTPVRILQSIPLLDAAAMRTVQEWQFVPAIKDGRRVASVARAPVTFTIY